MCVSTPSTCVKESDVPRRFKLSSPQEATGSSVALALTGCLPASLSVCLSATPLSTAFPLAAQFPCAVLYSVLDWLGDGVVE